MANRTTGAEPLDRPFKRRHEPGTSAGKYRVGYSAATWMMFTHANNLLDAARIARKRFGLPALLIDQILYPLKYPERGWKECRNNIKLMRLVSLCTKQLKMKRVWRKRALCTQVARRI